MASNARPRILCIEDEQDFRENIVDFLEHESYDVIEATNGAEGFEKITHMHPDIVLCDIQMPEMNGLEMLQKLQDTHPQIMAKTNFMFLSAFDDKQNTLNGYQLGCDDFMAKPIDYDVLLAKLKHQAGHLKSSEPEAQASLLHKHLPPIFATQLRRPLEILQGYSELLTGENSKSVLKSYLGHLQQTTQTQISQIELVSMLLDIQAHNYRPTIESTLLDAFLWEASVNALGYELASEQPPISAKTEVMIDRLSLNRLVTQFVYECHTYYQQNCVYSTPASNNAEQIELVVAEKEVETLEHVEWLSPTAMFNSSIGDSIKHFSGLSLCFASAINIHNMYHISFGQLSRKSLAMRISLPVSS